MSKENKDLEGNGEEEEEDVDDTDKDKDYEPTQEDVDEEYVDEKETRKRTMKATTSSQEQTEKTKPPKPMKEKTSKERPNFDVNLHQRNREKKKEIRKPENLNPLGMDEEKIPQGIVDGSIHVGPPPEGRSCNSPNWNQGMAFLFFSEDDEEVTNWYVLYHLR